MCACLWVWFDSFASALRFQPFVAHQHRLLRFRFLNAHRVWTSNYQKDVAIVSAGSSRMPPQLAQRARIGRRVHRLSLVPLDVNEVFVVWPQRVTDKAENRDQ